MGSIYAGMQPLPRQYHQLYADRNSNPSSSSQPQQHQQQPSSSMDGRPEDTLPYQAALTDDPSFDIIEWHPAYQSCQRYFLDHSQYEPGTQALCSLINIRLPFQWLNTPVPASSIHSPAVSAANPILPYNAYTRGGSNLNSPGHSRAPNPSSPDAHVSLIPYIRRLIVTGFDRPAILHGFFGDDYFRGVLPHVDCERRNYLFAAKSGGWCACKRMYDSGSGGGGDESVPFIKPLDEAKIEELTAAEKAWSSWLAMEDWMVGPRAPQDGSMPHGRNSTDRQHVNHDTVNGAGHEFNG